MNNNNNDNSNSSSTSSSSPPPPTSAPETAFVSFTASAQSLNNGSCLLKFLENNNVAVYGLSQSSLNPLLFRLETDPTVATRFAQTPNTTIPLANLTTFTFSTEDITPPLVLTVKFNTQVALPPNTALHNYYFSRFNPPVPSIKFNMERSLSKQTFNVLSMTVPSGSQTTSELIKELRVNKLPSFLPSELIRGIISTNMSSSNEWKPCVVTEQLLPIPEEYATIDFSVPTTFPVEPVPVNTIVSTNWKYSKHSVSFDKSGIKANNNTLFTFDQINSIIVQGSTLLIGTASNGNVEIEINPNYTFLHDSRGPALLYLIYQTNGHDTSIISNNHSQIDWTSLSSSNKRSRGGANNSFNA